MISITYALVPRKSDNGWLVERTVKFLKWYHRSYLSTTGDWLTSTRHVDVHCRFTKLQAMDHYYVLTGQFWALI